MCPGAYFTILQICTLHFSLCKFCGQSENYHGKRNHFTNFTMKCKVQSANLQNSEIGPWTVDFNSQNIEFQVTAITKGYVGFGISYTGDMKGDVVIGGIFDQNGTSYFDDRHVDGKTTPILDEKQDWKLLSASQTEGLTTLSFSRKFDTCDDNDVSITNDTLHIIWSIGLGDEIKMHTLRGSKQVNFLDPPAQEIDMSKYETWKIEWNSAVPTESDTAYWCTVHESPIFQSKTHVVGIEVVLDTPAAKKYTHHLVLRRCLAKPEAEWRRMMKSFIGHDGAMCFQKSELTPALLSCYDSFYVWAKGGSRMILPDNVGFPIGENGEQEYFVVEVHYDNPNLDQSDIQYKAAINVYHTTHLRSFDAGLLSIHHEANPTITIPPGVKDWVISCHCSPDCTKKAIFRIEEAQTQIDSDSVSIFNVLLHSHLSGRKIKLRHFRDGEELPWVANDDNYDFDFQQNRPLRENVKLQAGDQLTLECTYDSSWLSPHKAVIGGISTDREMCDAFILYYPAIKGFGLCTSTTSFSQIYPKFGITNVTRENEQSPFKVVSPGKWGDKWYHDVLDEDVYWIPELLKDLQAELRYSEHTSRCDNNWGASGTISYPKISKVYQPPNPCSSAHKNQSFSKLVFLLLPFNLAILTSVLKLFI